MSSSIRSEVQDFCANVGKDRLLTQGAGGNVSWKDQGIMHIKASGTWLVDANNKDIFTPIELQPLLDEVSAGSFSVPEHLTANLQLKPSIETMMHAILSHKVVVHLHVVDILAVLVRQNAKSLMCQIFDGKLDHIFIDYIKPGPDLAAAIYAELGESNIDVVFLKNHGVIIGGNSLLEVQAKLDFILHELESHVAMIELGECERQQQDIDGYHVLDVPELNELACNPKLLEQVMRNWVLYPDHVVFLGEIPNIAENFKEVAKVTEAGASYIIIKDYGVVVSDNALKSIICQLICYADVLVRQSNKYELSPLTKQEIDELVNWDSEKYRLKNSV